MKFTTLPSNDASCISSSLSLPPPPPCKPMSVLSSDESDIQMHPRSWDWRGRGVSGSAALLHTTAGDESLQRGSSHTNGAELAGGGWQLAEERPAAGRKVSVNRIEQCCHGLSLKNCLKPIWVGKKWNQGFNCVERARLHLKLH